MPQKRRDQGYSVIREMGLAKIYPYNNLKFLAPPVPNLRRGLKNLKIRPLDHNNTPFRVFSQTHP